MATNVKVDIAAEFVGKKAFNDAVKSTIGLNSQVKSLAKSYVGLFTVQRLGRAGFNAAKAFAADDKAARVLTQSLDNLGLAFADPSVKNFIADLEAQFGVLDDQLRPAFQKLLTTTGDVAKSQQLLRTALDLSAASGSDVLSVAGDLSKGYVGQTRALAKYGIGLTQAELKAMSFEEIQARINELFGGQAQISVDSYSGAMDRLTVAAANAQETIGKGLVDALSTLGGGGQGGLDNIITKIDTAANAIAALVSGTAKAFKLLDTVLNLQFTKIPGIFAKPAAKATITPAVAAELQKAAADKAAKKNRDALLKTTKEQTKAIKEQTALQKAGTLFDIQQAQVIAALKGNITDEERKRLELQLAILTGNTTEASKLAGELAKAQGLSKDLADYLANRLPNAKNPFAAWKDYLDMLEEQARRIASIQPGAPASVAARVPSYNGTAIDTITSSYGVGGATAGVDKAGNVNVYVAGNVVSEADLVEAVRNGLLEGSLSGSASSIGRLKGSFAG
jgi:hypothetical protein